MKKYLSFFRVRFLTGLQYRVAALAGLSTQLVCGVLEILIYRAFYLESPERMPMDMQAVASYIWLQQAFFSLFAVHLWEQELFEAIKTGTVAYELLRPTDLYGMWSARCVAIRLSKGLLRAVPVLIVGAMVPAPYGLHTDISLSAFGLFCLSMMLMIWVVVAMTMLYYSISFYMVDASGLTTLVAALSELLSGQMIPLPFFPEMFQRIAELSPFGAMANVPLRIFSGDISGAAIAQAMGLQLFWAAAITLLGYGLMRKGMSRIAVAGG